MATRRKNHDDEGVVRVSGGEGNFAGGEYISRSVCACVCARVFADPLRDGGRRQKTEWEGGREHERVGAESREGGRARERDDGKSRPGHQRRKLISLSLAVAEQAPARSRRCLGARGRRAKQVVIEVSRRML